MEEYSSEDGIESIEAKLNFLIHHLNQRILNDSLTGRKHDVKNVRLCAQVHASPQVI